MWLHAFVYNSFLFWVCWHGEIIVVFVVVVFVVDAAVVLVVVVVAASAVIVWCCGAEWSLVAAVCGCRRGWILSL